MQNYAKLFFLKCKSNDFTLSAQNHSVALHFRIHYLFFFLMANLILSLSVYLLFPWRYHTTLTGLLSAFQLFQLFFGLSALASKCLFSFSSSSSVPQLCLTLCNPTDCSTPGFPVHHQLPEPTQTHVHCIGDAIQPSHPLLSPPPPAFNLSQHQGLFKWVSSSH